MKSCIWLCVLTDRVPYRPVREAVGVTEVTEVVDVAKQLIFQLRKDNYRNGAVLIQSTSVALEPRSEISQVSSDLLDHHTPACAQTHIPKLRAVAFFILPIIII